MCMTKIINYLYGKKKFLLYAFLRIFVKFLGLTTNIIIIRALPITEYGVFSIVLMLVGLITTFGFSWSSSSILYYGSKEKAQSGSVNKTFWARNIIISFSLIITSVVFFIFRTHINRYIGIDAAFLVLIWLYVSVAEDYLNQYFLAVKRQIMSTLLSITAKIIYIVLILVISFDVKTLIIINIISHASVLLYSLGINSKDVSRFEYDKEWFKEILNFSLWQLFGFSGLYLINFGDTAVIKYFMTTDKVGIYNAAYKLFEAVANFVFIISGYYAGAASQFFENRDHKSIKSFFYKERFLIFGLSLIAHFMVMILSKPIIIKLYGYQYIESVLIFNILMVGSIFRYIGVFYMLYYNTNKKYKLQQAINIFRAILNIILDIIFIQLFGLIGPAIATTTAIVLTFLISFLYCEKRIYKLARPDLELEE